MRTPVSRTVSGWLREQLELASKEAATWPAWKRAELEARRRDYIPTA